MRIAPWTIPLFAVFLMACDQNQNTPDTTGQTPPAAEQPADTGMTPQDPDANSSGPAEDRGTGLGTEFGSEGGDVTDPATGEGTGTTQ